MKTTRLIALATLALAAGALLASPCHAEEITVIEGVQNFDASKTREITKEIVDDAEAPGGKILRLITEKSFAQINDANAMISPIETGVKEGDEVEVTFQARGVVSNASPAVLGFVFGLSKPPYMNVVQKFDMTLGSDWQEFSFKKKAKEAVPADILRCGFMAGLQAQEVQIAGLKVVIRRP